MAGGSPISRVAGALAACLFAVSAALQWNDPDPWRWAAIYVAAVGVCAVTPWRPLPPWLPLGLLGVSLAWALSLLVEVLRETAWTGTEIERELGGLLLVAVASGWALRVARRAGRAASAAP